MKYSIVPVVKIDQGHGHWHYATSGQAVRSEDIPELRDALTRELEGCTQCKEKVDSLLAAINRALEG